MEPDTVEQVTSDKPKNPGRVEWGRKLGKLSKERKKLKKEMEEKNVVSADQKFLVNPYIGLLAISGILITIGTLYYKTYYCSSSENIDNKSQSIETEKAEGKLFSKF